jgi:hypothetical protein
MRSACALAYLCLMCRLVAMCVGKLRSTSVEDDDGDCPKSDTVSVFQLNCTCICALQTRRSAYLWRVDSPPDDVDTSLPTQSSTTTAAPPLPRLPQAYLFGTVHVPYTRVWPHIAPAVKRAFHSAQHVYFELDLNDKRTVALLFI